jgi:protein-S-isoprenylcysteine O-methyltransferase Ste14
MRPDILFAIAWIGWVVSWFAAALWSGRTQKRDARGAVWAYRAAIAAGAVLLWHGTARVPPESRIWHLGSGGDGVLAGVTVIALLFTWWARIHLGRLWSSAITRKEGHRIVDGGPYAFVRHPIYTGLIAATAATAAAQASAVALIGAALIAFGLWLKARAEERFLMAELGPDAYGPYRRRVPMLVPFLRRG